MKGFKVISEASDSYHLKHDKSGKTFTVDKEGLSPKAHEAIKKYCMGGDVQSYSDGGIAEQFAEDAQFKQEQAQAAQDQIKAQQDLENSKMIGPQADNMQNDSPFVRQQTAEADAARAPAAARVQQAQAPAPEAAPNSPMAPAPVQASAQAYPAAPIDPLTSRYQSTDSLYNNQENDIKGYIKSLGANDAAAKQVIDQYDQQSQGLKTPQQIHDEYKAKDDALFDQYMNKQVDPNRYLNNMSTGSKILSALAIGLSGAGSGAGNPNVALNILQGSIDKDIDSQKNDQSKSMTLWKMNRENMQSDEEATLATKNQLLTGTQAKLAMISNQSNNAASKLKATEMYNQIEQQKIANRTQLGLLTQGAQGGAGFSNIDPAVLVPSLVPAEHQKQVFTELGQAKSAQDNEQNILQLFDQAAKDTRPTTGRSTRALMNTVPGYNPPSVKGLNLLYDPLIHDNEGRINELEQQHVQANTPQWGDSDETVQEKRQHIIDFINHKKQATTASAFGLNPERFYKSTQSGGQIQYSGGLPYRRVNGGWQLVK